MKKTMSIMIMALSLLMSGAAFAADTLNGAGASFPYPVYSAWAYDYNKATGTRLNYQSIGSGGGVRQISERTVDFGASDDPMKPEDLAKNKLYQFPAVIGGVVPVVNIKGLKEAELKLAPETLCGIFMGKITKWDDKAVASINPGLVLPSADITVVHRSDGSGTTAIFTTYLAAVCPEWAEKAGAGKAVNWPIGIGGKGNEGVANYVNRMPNSIGYVEYAYAKQNKLNYSRLKNSAGNFVAPSTDAFKDAASSANFDPANHFYLWLANAPGKNAWPIAGATFILLAEEKTESNKKVVQFFDWAFKNGDPTAERLVYVPLPDALKEKIRAYWKQKGIY